MKTRPSRRQIATVSNSRWLAYAAAGAATALAGSNSAEAAIHYSGLLREHFPPDQNKLETFPLDQAGDYFLFRRTSAHVNSAGFTCYGIVSSAFRGDAVFDIYYVSRLHVGKYISQGRFVNAYPPPFFGIMAYDGVGEWVGAGTGYVGFRFNSGAGVQYGWVRVRMAGDPENAFSVVDYAYADPGEPIRAGQKSSAEMVTDEGSLGWLALGAAGLLAWRKSRSRAAR
jgi:hypothetical protein